MGRKKGSLNKKTLAKQSGNSNEGQLKLPTPSSNGTAEHKTTDIPKIPPKTEQPKTDIDPDMFSDDIPNNVVDPLSEPVKAKAHTQINVDPTKSGGAGDNKGGGNKSFEPTPDNKSGNTQQPKMTPDEVKTAGDLTVSLFLRGYEKINAFGRWYGKMDKQDLAAMELQGKINLQQSLPFRDDEAGTDTTTLSKFIDNYNKTIDADIVVDKDFVRDITPPLTRLVIKHNILVNDLAAVISLVVEDVATKGGVLFGLKKSVNMILDLCQKEALRQKKSEETPPQKQAEAPKQQESTNPPNNPRTDNSVISDAVIEEEVHHGDDWSDKGGAGLGLPI